MTELERNVTLELLQDPQLLPRILADYAACGLVGEETNKRVCYLDVWHVSRCVKRWEAASIQAIPDRFSRPGTERLEFECQLRRVQENALQFFDYMFRNTIHGKVSRSQSLCPSCETPPSQHQLPRISY